MWSTMRPGSALVPLFVLICISIAWRFYNGNSLSLPFHISRAGDDPFSPHPEDQQVIPSHDSIPIPPFDASLTHTEVFSVSTSDRKYFRISFGDKKGINPNVIPHPIFNDTWIVTAQHHNTYRVTTSVFFSEIVCEAVYVKDTLACTSSPFILPIAKTGGGSKCSGRESYFSWSIGPHDARVFYGPENPYVMYGSTSEFTCFGQWMLDFRFLVDWGLEPAVPGQFITATEIQRPGSYGPIEKNWFVFWDRNGQMYGHYDIAPKRTFAKLEYDGTVGSDLAPAAAATDEKCMAKYMPKVAVTLESLHQATNSLSITLCKRADPSCVVNDDNTFVITIFHHKTFYDWHGVYEPYVMLFKQVPPFEVHGISEKSIWVHGRGTPGKGRKPDILPPELAKTWNQTEMFFTTSISWKTHGQKYHGYIDDIMLIGFGIEDRDTGGIDVVAGDLLVDMGVCSTLKAEVLAE